MVQVRIVTRGIDAGGWIETTAPLPLPSGMLAVLGVSDDEVVHMLFGPEDELFVVVGRAAAVVLDALDRRGVQDRMVFSTWRHRIQKSGSDAERWLQRLADKADDDADGLWWPQEVGWICADGLRVAYRASSDWDSLTLLAWGHGGRQLLDEIADGLRGLDRRPF